MRTPQETIFEQTWLEVQELAKKSYQCDPASAPSPIKVKAHEKYMRGMASLSLDQIEKSYSMTFRAWLVNKYHDRPKILVQQLLFLERAGRPLQSPTNDEDSFIEQVCTKPKAIEILGLIFQNLQPFSYHIFTQRPPYINPSISQEVFCYLLENQNRYSQFYPPVFWAMINNEIHLMDRILSVKPEWVNLKNEVGENALMVAIQLKKEDAIIKLLEFNPDLSAINQQGETIAHLACQTDEFDWLHELLTEPRFAGLQLDEMIANPELFDKHHQIPLNHAFFKGYIDLVKEKLAEFPVLKGPVFGSYYMAVEKNQPKFLDLLYNELNLKFTDFEKLQVSYFLHALKHSADIALMWMMDNTAITSNFRKSIILLNQIEKNNVVLLHSHFQTFTVNWSEVPPQIAFKITVQLLKKNHSALIARLGLFDFHPHFLAYNCDVTKERNTFINYIILETQVKLSPEFVTYLLSFLETHHKEYPNWLAEFNPDITYIIDRLGIDKNILVHGQPLLHFLENCCYQNYSAEKRNSVMRAFNNPRVLVNVKNSEQKHLFAKLLTESPQAFERIVMLKNIFSDLSFENLDNRGSNLLHLAIETSNLDCIRWGLNQNIDAFTIRESDGMHAAQLILDSGNIEMFDILRKHIKKSAFLTFIQDLISQKKDELIAYLFSFERPFSWFTEFHFSQLKTLLHPVIQSRFTPAPAEKLAEVVIEKPKVEIPNPKEKSKPIIELNFNMIKNLIDTQNQKRFELLIQEPYQAPLQVILEEHFFDILYLVFRSECKNLNKILIRIPAVQDKITQHDAWHVILNESIRLCDIQIIENMLGRQGIVDQIQPEKIEAISISNIKDIWHGLMCASLRDGKQDAVKKLIRHPSLIELYQARKMDYYAIAMTNHPLLWSETLFRRLPVNTKELEKLFTQACSSDHVNALHLFLSQSEHREMFISAPSEFWMKIISKGYEFLMVCLEHEDIEQKLINHCREYFLEALLNHHIQIAYTLLAFPQVRQNFKAGGRNYFNDLLSNGLEPILLPLWANHKELAPLVRPYLPIAQVELPALIREAFNVGYTGQNILFLVGSTILYLLEGRSLETLNDVDFVSTTQPYFIHSAPSSPRCSPIPATAFAIPTHFGHCLPYKQSKVQPQTFFTTLNRTKLEYYVSATDLSETDIRNPRNFIAENFSKRDFTVNSLYCDIYGIVFDPSGLGIRDFQERRIRCIGNPDESFASDPIRILRAVRLMMKGFQLNPEVKEAIMKWRRNGNVNFSHLYVMTHQMICMMNAHHVLDILKQLNLLQRLLSYNGEESIGSLQAFLSSEIYRCKHGAPSASPSKP